MGVNRRRERASTENTRKHDRQRDYIRQSQLLRIFRLINLKYKTCSNKSKCVMMTRDGSTRFLPLLKNKTLKNDQNLLVDKCTCIIHCTIFKIFITFCQLFTFYIIQVFHIFSLVFNPFITVLLNF